MNIYRVRGRMSYEWFCRCEHCQGHTAYEQVDEQVEATNQEAADDQVLHAFQPHEPYSQWDNPFWEDDPFVEYLGVVGEDVWMRRSGEPMLPGFELDLSTDNSA